MNLDDFLKRSGFSAAKIADIRAMIRDEAEREKQLPSATEGIRVRGWLNVFHHDPATGGTVLISGAPNLVVQGGYLALSSMFGATGTLQMTGSPDTYRPDWIAAGDNNTVAAITQTQLVSERFRKQVATRTFINTTISGSSTQNGITYQMTMLTSEGGTFTYREAGLFANNGTSGANTGRMLARQVFPDIQKSSSFELVFQWSFTFSP